MTEAIKLTKRELDALVECDQVVRGTYSWRVKSMEKLVAKGFAEEVTHIIYGGRAWAVTDAGCAYLDRLEVSKCPSST